MAGDTQNRFHRVVTETTQFSDLDGAEQEWVLDTRSIIFQGNETNLRELLTPLPKADLNEIVTSDVLLRLSKNEKITIGRKVESLVEGDAYCYIPRSVHKLRSYDPEIIPEKVLSRLDRYDNEDLIAMGDISGAGKTTFLTSLANGIKKERPNLWVFKIDLNSYSKFFWEFKKNNFNAVTLLDLLNSRIESKLTNGLEKKIFSIASKVIILDGINEVSPDYKNAILEVIGDCQSKRNDCDVKRTINRLVLSALPNLEQEMNVQVSHHLKPLSERDLVRFLQKYWEQKFELTDDKKSKCEVYAKTVTQKWFKHKTTLIGTPLLIRMIAEILEHKENFKDGEAEWEGCYDFLSSANIIPTLPKEPTLTELYQLYIYKNCSGNARGMLNSLRSDIAGIHLNCECYLHVLALETVLDERRCDYFSCYRSKVDKTHEGKLPQLRILKKVDGELRFTHRSLAEYFLAECISYELREHPTEQFLGFLLEEVLVEERFKVVRKFFDSFLLTDLDGLTKETFRILGDSVKEKEYHFLLYTSTVEGLLGILKLLLKCCEAAEVSVDLNNIAEKGNHGIHAAAEGGHHSVVKFLIENGCCVDFRNRKDCTLLHLAAKAGSLEMVKFLVEKGLEVDCKDGKGRTALHRATKKGSVEMVGYLLEHGAYVNSRSKWGYTPLHIATEISDFDKVKLLVENGAAVDYRGHRSGTVMSTAVLGGSIDVVEYLVEKGADVMVRNRSGGTMLHLLPTWSDDKCLKKIIALCVFLMGKGVDINSVNDFGETVLYTAVKREYKVEFLRFLVERGVNIDVVNNYNETALTYAISKNRVDIVRYLLENGAEFNASHNQDNVIYDAVRDRHYEVIKFLGDSGVPLNPTSDSGRSPLCCAVYNDDQDMVKLLVENGAKINGVEILKETLEKCNLNMVKYLVEHGAKTEMEFDEVSNGNLGVIEFLVENGSKFKTFKNVGNDLYLLKFLINRGIDVDKTAIFFSAAESGNLDIVRFLLEKGIDVNSKTDFGSTALHWAAKYNHVDVLKFLLLHGADVNAKDQNGNTPLYSAASHGSLEAAKVLVEKGADVKNTDVNLLSEAINMGYTDTVKYLVEQGAPLNVNGEYWGNALCAAFIYERFEILDFLLGRDAGFTWTYKEIVKRLLPCDCEPDQEDQAVSTMFNTIGNVKYLIRKGVELGSEEINQREVLFTAVKANDFKLAKYLIHIGCDVNSRNCYGRTALHETVDLNLVKLLVEHGADVNAKDEYGCSVMCRAVENSNLDVCKFLVQSGVNVEEEEDETGRTLLHMKIYDYGDMSPDKIKYLIESGAELKLTKNGRSVVHDMIATSHIDLDMIKYILKRGVDVDCRDSDGITPLDEAVIAGDLDVVRLLVEKGAGVDNIKDVILFRAVESYHHGNWDHSLDMVKFLVRKGANVNARDESGRTLLHKAIEQKLVEIAKYLIDVGADVNSVDQNGTSPLHEACGSGNLPLIKFLIEKGGLLDVETSKGRTVLHEAALSGCFNAVKFLIENGCDVNLSDRDGRTPLHEVSRSSFSYFSHNEGFNTAKLLIESGARLDIKTRKGYTPLHDASSNASLDLVKLFVENGADVNARDEYGRTALFSLILASKENYRNCDKNILEFLLKSGADLGHKADNQRTVLHEASIIGKLELVEMLVRLGADVNAKTRAGRTPLHDAARRGMLEVVEFLVREGAEVEAETTQGTTALDEATKGEHEEIVDFFTKRSAAGGTSVTEDQK